MSTQTTNYNLIKPEYTDTPDITSMNPNWDIIDTKLKEAMESGGSSGVIPTKVSQLENDLEFAQIDDLAGFLSNGGGALYGDIDLVGDGSAISGAIVFNNDAEANTPYIIADFPEYDPGDNARLRLGGAWDDSEVILDGIAEPREDNHAATKKYVDDKAAAYLPLAGGTVTGATTFNGAAAFTKDVDFTDTIHDTIQLRTWNVSTGAEILFTIFPESKGISFYRAGIDEMPLIPISVGPPQTIYDAATKGYVDDKTDKATIVNAVIEALPKYAGEVS